MWDRRKDDSKGRTWEIWLQWYYSFNIFPYSAPTEYKRQIAVNYYVKQNTIGTVPKGIGISLLPP